MTNKMSEDKIIKNPARSNGAAEYKNYTPQYRILGLKAEEVNFSPRENILLATDKNINEDNGRFKKDMFSIENKSESGDVQENFSIPNVGNNVEQLWTQTDEEDLDNLEIKLNKNVNLSEDNTKYILVAKDEIIFIGNKVEVEQEIKKIFYEEHDLCKSKNITIDDLVILKKIKIKVGVFLED